MIGIYLRAGIMNGRNGLQKYTGIDWYQREPSIAIKVSRMGELGELLAETLHQQPKLILSLLPVIRHFTQISGPFISQQNSGLPG